MAFNDELRKQYYEHLYESHVLKQYRAYIQNKEPDEDEELLGRYTLDLRRHPEMLENLPESIRGAYNYYDARIAKCGLGCVRVSLVPYSNDFTYAVRVSTDGDDGWLEIYDQHGCEIGVGRTYMELIGWGKIDEIRRQVDDFDFPVSLSDKEKKTLWQFGSCVIRKNSSKRFFVIAEEIPSDRQKDAIKIICDATGVRDKAVSIVLEYLPHSVTRNISKQQAEDICQKLTELGAKAYIKEFSQS